MTANLPAQEIEARLEILRRRIRQVQLKRALWVTTTVALAGLLAIMAADYFLAPLPDAVRWALFVLWLAALAFTVRSVARPLLKPIGLIRIARWIETRHPEIQERLSTVLELSKQAGGISPGLLEALAKAAGDDVLKVDPQGEIRSAQTKLRWGRPAATLGGILLVSLLLWPKEASRLLVRAVAPFSGIGNAGAVKFDIAPGDLEVMEGDRIEITIGYHGSAERLDFVIGMEGRNPISQPLAREGKSFRYVLDPARESFTYRVQSAREQSDVHTATVWPRPQLIDPRVTLEYPAYTGLQKQEQSPAEGIEAVEGSTLRLDGKLNTAAGQGWLEVNGKRVADAEIDPSSTGGRVGFSWKLSGEAGGEAVVKFRHRLGREVEALRFPVKVLPDQNPQVVIVAPSQKELKVRPDEVLDVRYEVIEDFSLARAAVEIEAGGKTARLDLTLPFAVKGTRPPRFEGSSPVAVGQLRTRFPGANEMKLRVQVEDGRPPELGGPGIGRSEWITLRIDRNAESLARQELRAEHEGARETIEKAFQEARQAKDQIDSLRDEVKKESMNDNAVKRLAQSTEKLAAAEQKMAELAQAMEQGIHAAKADEVRQAVGNLQESREDLENAPLQDKQESREAKLNEAKENAGEAIRQLEEVRNAMDRDREKVQDLARMQELAQQQQELARQAQENLQKPPPSPQADPSWQNQQKQLAEALRQQLHGRPDAKAEALKAQAEEAKAMAGEARRVANEQKDLQEQAKQPDPAAVKRQLQESLAKAQSEIAAETKEALAQARQERSEVADILPEATHAADAALERLQKSDLHAAAGAAKEAAGAMKTASGQNASAGAATPEPAPPDPDGAEAAAEHAAVVAAARNPARQAARAAQAEALRELADRQQQLAGAMEALANDDPAAALQALQKAQAEAAAALAEEVRTMPRVDDNGPLNEAIDNARQGAERSENAAKEGAAGRQQQAAGQHEQATLGFSKTAEALDHAAREFADQAQQAAQQAVPSNKAQLPAAPMAAAFQQAAAAATGEGAEAARQAAEAATALSQAAQAGREQLQGLPQPGSPGQAKAPGPNGQPGEKAADRMDTVQQRSASPGVPPELAKLGISASDWEKIQATLKSDVGAGGPDAIPEEYRGLVKGYFESMSKKKD